MNIRLQLIINNIVLITMLFTNTLVHAEDDSYLLQSSTHAALTEIHKDMEKGDNDNALIKLKKLTLTEGLKGYDVAVIYQTMGFAENGLGNFNAAAAHFIKALSFQALPATVTHDLNFSTAQILIHIEKEKEGLKYLSKWFSNEPSPKADAHILAATAYYNLKDYSQLIVHVEKALSLNNNPPLNWYELLLAAYYENKNYKKAAGILETIISRYPDKTDYWLQLAGIYQQLKLEKKSLAIYELAYTKGILGKDEISQLVKNYLYLEMPYKAATILEKEMAIGDIEANKEMLTLLVDSWILAHEYSKAKSVFKEIIKKYNDDNTRLRLGQLYIESEEWDSAVSVLDVKLQTNDKVLHSKINLLLGIARYHTENLSGATRAFTQALSDKSTAEQARWWLEHLKKKSESTQRT